MADKPYLLKSAEDIFFLYAGQSKELESSNQAESLRLLKKALQAYPDMKKGVEFLIKKVSDRMKQVEPAAANREPSVSKESTSNSEPAVNNELAAYAQIVKKNIRQMLDQKMYKEAKEIITGFEEILPGDPDIQAMKKELEGNGVQV